MLGAPAAPLANTNNVSLVEVSPSTEMELKLASTNKEIEQNKSAILDLMRRLAQTNSRLGHIEIERKNIASQQSRLAERRQVVVAELETLAYLSNLYVKESARGGAGTRLLGAALTWARANRVERILLWPTRRSGTLYLRHGFSHGGEVMELRVDAS